tara:strand:- start:1566 stop:2147 length:582 start_codon:yes stop_codon:yes gene_type:complete
MIDLFSGLGGASEAAVEAGWQVHRCEKNAMFHAKHGKHPVPHTIIGDVMALRPAWLRSLGPIHLLWASPPCDDFARLSMPWTRKKLPDDFKPDLSLILKAVEIRDFYAPRYWCFENVIGSIPYLRPILGDPTQIIGPFVLWHNLPHIMVEPDFSHSKQNFAEDPLRPWLRAKIPIELSRAVIHAACTPTLEDF